MDTPGIKKLKKIALDHLDARLSPVYTYHNRAHAEAVARAAQELGAAEGCTEAELELLTLGAIFHDFGYLDAGTRNEAAAGQYAEEFLRDCRDGETIAKLKALIMETEFPYQPTSKLGQILCDADLCYIGDANFSEIAARFRDELAALGQRFSDREWLEFEIKFLSDIEFFTRTAQERRNGGKMKNLAALRRRAAAL